MRPVETEARERVDVEAAAHTPTGTQDTYKPLPTLRGRKTRAGITPSDGSALKVGKCWGAVTHRHMNKYPAHVAANGKMAPSHGNASHTVVKRGTCTHEDVGSTPILRETLGDQTETGKYSTCQADAAVSASGVAQCAIAAANSASLALNNASGNLRSSSS